MNVVAVSLTFRSDVENAHKDRPVLLYFPSYVKSKVGPYIYDEDSSSITGYEIWENATGTGFAQFEVGDEDAPAMWAEIPTTIEYSVDHSFNDKERIDWLEEQTKKSRTGIGFDHVPSVEGEPSGYRFMRRGYISEARKGLREAIDYAIRLGENLSKPTS